MITTASAGMPPPANNILKASNTLKYFLAIENINTPYNTF
jgi:hypothetical protein